MSNTDVDADVPMAATGSTTIERRHSRDDDRVATLA